MKDLLESGEPGQPLREIKVLIAVPEEYLGASTGELQLLDGWITSMEAHQSSVVLAATLPAANYSSVTSAGRSSTAGRGRVDLAEG